MTGIFTCPIKGQYVFTWSILTNDKLESVLVTKGGNIRIFTQSTGERDRFNSGSNTAILDLEENDKVSIGYLLGMSFFGNGGSTFSGWKI